MWLLILALLSSSACAMGPVDEPIYCAQHIEDKNIKNVKTKLKELEFLIIRKQIILGDQLYKAQRKYEYAVCDNDLPLIKYCEREIDRIEVECSVMYSVLNRNAINERVVPTEKGRMILQDPRGNLVNPITKLIALSGPYFDERGDLKSVIPEDDLLEFLAFFIDKKMGIRKHDEYEESPAHCLLSAALNLRPKMVRMLMDVKTGFTPDMLCGRYTVSQRVLFEQNSKAYYHKLSDKKVNETCIRELQHIYEIMHESHTNNMRLRFKTDFNNIIQ